MLFRSKVFKRPFIYDQFYSTVGLKVKSENSLDYHHYIQSEYNGKKYGYTEQIKGYASSGYAALSGSVPREPPQESETCQHRQKAHRPILSCMSLPEILLEDPRLVCQVRRMNPQSSRHCEHDGPKTHVFGFFLVFAN